MLPYDLFGIRYYGKGQSYVQVINSADTEVGKK